MQGFLFCFYRESLFAARTALVGDVTTFASPKAESLDSKGSVALPCAKAVETFLVYAYGISHGYAVRNATHFKTVITA